MPEAILLQDVEYARREGHRRRRLRRATCATTSSRASSPSPPPAAPLEVGPAARWRRPSARQQRGQSPAPRRTPQLLQRTVLTITQQAGEDGRLFGSVTAQDIADAIKDARGIKVDRRKVHLEEPDPPRGHPHGRRRGLRRRDGDRQDDGRRAEVTPSRSRRHEARLADGAPPRPAPRPRRASARRQRARAAADHAVALPRAGPAPRARRSSTRRRPSRPS